MSVLEEIVARKRSDVTARAHSRSIDDLRRAAVPARRRLAERLRGPGLRFILECKRASPSAGILRKSLDLAAIAQVYREFADGVSVLTDGPYFGGDHADIAALRSQLDQPILCKDFMLEPYQIVEARVAGADAVLLMLSVLSDEAYRACAAEAARWQMEILTEVHNESELQRALQLDAEMIGINNRDLHTLQVDLNTTRRLAPAIPEDRIVVCESGIRSRADVDAVEKWVDAYLVGSQLMQAERLDLAVRRLIFGDVKICGLTTVDQRNWAFDAGATRGGLIFAAESPRRVDDETAAAMAENSPLPLVGVFVNESVDGIVARATKLALAAVQLHGEETPEMVECLRKALPRDCEIWKAVRIGDRIPETDEFGADRLVLDTFDPQNRGGTGRRFDWNLLKAIPNKDRFIVSGGIGPENVAAAQALGCHCLDVNSGVESSPGTKDPQRIRRLFAALRGAA